MKKRHFYTENVAISPQKVVAFRRFLAKNASIKNHKKGLLKIFRKKLLIYSRTAMSPPYLCTGFESQRPRRLSSDCRQRLRKRGKNEEGYFS